MAEHEQETSRVAAWEWLRAGAALGVVLLHASAPYLWHPMPGLTWAVTDRRSRIVDLLGWTIELFIMPLFLVMAGYFAFPLWQRLGSGGFMRHRSRRLLGPLALAVTVILPMDLYVFLLGWVVEGRIEARKMRSLKFEGGVDANLWGLSHLWFLQYLFLYCLALVAAAACWSAVRRFATRFGVRQRALWMGGGWAAVAVVTLAMHPEVVFGFQHSFLPVASKWIYSGAFFAGGVWLATYDADLRQTMRWGWRWLALAAVTAVASLSLGIEYLSGGGAGPHWSLAIATVAAAWAITVGLIGIAGRHLRTAGPAVRYLASASFWTYLLHHPIVCLLHIDVKVLLPDLFTPLKPLLVTSVAIGCCLLSFEGLVRRTWLGRLLGVRPQPADAGDKTDATADSGDPGNACRKAA